MTRFQAPLALLALILSARCGDPPYAPSDLSEAQRSAVEG